MRMRIPATMMMIEKKIFQPPFVRSTARLPRVNSPPTSQYAPRNVIKSAVVMPDAGGCREHNSDQDGKDAPYKQKPPGKEFYLGYWFIGG
jgi:hypothetical protein